MPTAPPKAPDREAAEEQTEATACPAQGEVLSARKMPTQPLVAAPAERETCLTAECLATATCM